MTAKSSSLEVLPRTALRMTLTGRVQGVGLRPAIARCARQWSLTGYVNNTRAGVEIHLEGNAVDMQQFEHALFANVPARAEVHSLQRNVAELVGYTTFQVEPMADAVDDALSHEGTGQGRGAASPPLVAHVPPDIVACRVCLAEVHDVTTRRHNYPFTSCTDCGPRYSILERMPYDRARTSMAGFPLCEACRDEYASAENRRFHAQTNACPVCGPQVWLHDAERVVARGQDALKATVKAVRAGQIVALRGLGGYQLLVDATSQESVERLRLRKRRPGKPLAVMVASLANALRIVRLDDDERRVLSGPAGPIVVATARGDARLAASVSQGLNTIGVMLPSTPLHSLLLEAVGCPLVCTSGNVDAEPLVYQSDLAASQLRGVADVWFEHDRPIVRPIDDSVVRVMAGRPVALRLARGYAPLPLDLEDQQGRVALGGHFKASIALSNSAQAVLGPHIGDLDSIAARNRYVQQVDAFSALYGVDTCPRMCDLHPEYFTGQWADHDASPVVRVQHHHAHVVAGMLEHGWLDRKTLGVAFDGTGYGADATIWGGEFLVCWATGFERVGHLRPFVLAGNELAVRQPWRVATALVRDAAGDDTAARLGFTTGDVTQLLAVVRRPGLSPVTTSAGRLFDGVAALVLGVERCQFEGQAAMLLEAACDPAEQGHYELPITNDQLPQLDWRPLVRHVLRDRAAGVSPGAMATRFHRGMALAIGTFCQRYSALPVVLGGGVFQNRVLVELLSAQFAASNQMLGLPGLIPPNDGGLAAGQLAIGAALARQRSVHSCA